MSPRLSDLLLSSQSDERLVGLARTGHERAFAVIVERYRDELHAFARRLCSDGRSEDIVQQAFLSAFAALRAGSEVRHLRGWLYQIVRNAATRRAGPPCVPLDGATASLGSLEDEVQQRALALTALAEMARLPTRQRQAFVGTALDGRPRAEVASSMGLSEGAVRQLVHRARTTLRGAVTAVTPWPLARWIAAIGPDAPAAAQAAGGVGAASSGGLVLKLGALLASGTFLTGVAVQVHGPTPHPAGARAIAGISGHARPLVARARPAALASVTRPVSVQFVSARATVEAAVSPGLASGRSGTAAVGTSSPADHRGSGARGDGRRDGGSDRERHDDNGGRPQGGNGSDGRDGHAGVGAASSGSNGGGSGASDSGGSGSGGSGSGGSGLDGGGSDGGGSDGATAGGRSAGGDGARSDQRSAAGSDSGEAAQMASRSRGVRSAVRGSDSGQSGGD